MASHAHDTAMARLRHDQGRPRHGRLRARECGRARACGLASEVCRDTIRCIVIGGTARLRYGWGNSLTTRPRCATIRCWALRHLWQRATQRTRMTLVLGVSRYMLRHGRPGLRHGRPHATIQLDTSPRHDRDKAVLGAVRPACARRFGSRCALGAPYPVLTQCTILSHCLGHCSRTLFTRFKKKK